MMKGGDDVVPLAVRYGMTKLVMNPRWPPREPMGEELRKWPMRAKISANRKWCSYLMENSASGFKDEVRL